MTSETHLLNDLPEAGSGKPLGGNTGILVPDEMLQTFRAGSTTRLVVKLDSPQEAEALRFKLHHVRKQMRRYNHPDLAAAERCTFQVQQNDLIVRPSTDSKYRDALAQAVSGAEILPVKKEKGNGRARKGR